MEFEKEILEKIHQLEGDISEIKKLITELHSIFTGGLYKDKSSSEKPLTKKQRDEAMIEELRMNAHNKIRLNGYKR